MVFYGEMRGMLEIEGMKTSAQHSESIQIPCHSSSMPVISLRKWLLVQTAEQLPIFAIRHSLPISRIL
jgi:hypothetical protein